MTLISPLINVTSVAKPFKIRFGTSQPVEETLHRNHPYILKAITVLTKGSSSPSVAFRQKKAFTLRNTKGELLSGKAGSYLLIHKVPTGVAVTNELVQKLLKEGIPSKDYWVNIVDGQIMHNSYSFKPESNELIGHAPKKPGFNQPTNVYKAADLKQKALIPQPNQTKLTSLEGLQTIKPHQLVLLDVEGNPYPKNADQLLDQYKPDPTDARSQAFFEQVRQKYNLA